MRFKQNLFNYDFWRNKIGIFLIYISEIQIKDPLA
jgi:hypothetical protein